MLAKRTRFTRVIDDILAIQAVRDATGYAYRIMLFSGAILMLAPRRLPAQEVHGASRSATQMQALRPVARCQQ